MSRGRVKQRGMTLVELMLAVTVLGILMVVISPMVSSALQFTEAAGRKENIVNNQKLAQALLRHASTTKKGELAAPPAGRKWGVVENASPEGLKAEIQAVGFTLSDEGPANTSAVGLNHVKVYRVVKEQEIEIPLYFTTGTEVKLKYDVGVVYQTTCPPSAACANADTPGGAGTIQVTGAEGVTPEFNKENLQTWDVKGEDFGAVMFNTLDIQKDRLRITLGRVNRLTDRISSYYYARARTENINLNHFPTQPGIVASNVQNCLVTWIKLEDSSVMDQLGLDSKEFGVTAWGGEIQYCRDYWLEPTAPPLIRPHYAAIRFNKDLSAGASPSTTASENVVITF